MKKIKLEHSGYEIGDLCERILLQDRSIVPPIYNSVDFTEAFANTAIWAGINPIKGDLYWIVLEEKFKSLMKL